MMFGSSNSGNKRPPAPASSQVETIIGHDTKFQGSISAGGTIRVDGEVEGDITTAGDLVVGETGVVKAQVKARNAMVAGMVTGNVDVEERLELLSSCKLYGDIRTGKLLISEGALFKGACEMRREGSGTSE